MCVKFNSISSRPFPVASVKYGYLVNRRIQDQLMWIDIDTEESKKKIHQDLNKIGKLTKKGKNHYPNL